LGRSRPLAVLLTLAIVVLVIVDVAVIIDKGSAGYYTYSPGTAPLITASSSCVLNNASDELLLPNGQPCVQLGVPARLVHAVSGSLFMVDVLVGRTTPTDYVLWKLGLLKTFAPDDTIYSKVAVNGEAPASQMTCDNDEEMVGATSSAAVVALQRLGYSVREELLGAQLVEVVPGSPAAKAGLQCNDTVVAIGSTAVHTATDLVNAVHVAKPGQTISVTVHRVGGNGKTETLTFKAKLSGTPAEPGDAGTPADPHQAFLGVAASGLSTYAMPFNVNINVGDIGGPSAGLALTLGLLNVLSDGDLTGGHRVAATGTISVGGAVGDVGGVAQKTVAVRRAGAQYFLVPPQELQVARSKAGSMQVVAVSTLQQALTFLKNIGGHIPSATGGQNGAG
jgi:PDZ domain-containing protein